MPLSRFLDDRLRRGKYEAYLEKPINSFNPSTIDDLQRFNRNDLKIAPEEDRFLDGNSTV